MDGRKRGGDEIYRFFRACADWPEMIEHGQAIAVEVGGSYTHCHVSM